MKKIVLIMFVSIVMFAFNCKTNEDINSGIDQEKAEASVGLAAKTVTSLITSVYQSSISLSNDGTEASSLLVKGIDINATYDAETGWWTINFNYDGYQASLKIQLKSTSGEVQKDFAANTGSVLVKGDGSGTDLTFTIDWTVSGTELASSAYKVNGTGNIEYKGESLALSISDTEIKKKGATNPSSGTLTVEVGGINFVLNYDGNAIITVTYIYDGENHKIVVNIHTGEITRLS